MEYLTAEQIADLTDDKDGIANIRAINKLYRDQDESHLWPICNEFNATERAIRRIRNLNRAGACINPGLEYCYALDGEISQIVNREV
jgi:hypothetical protein